MIYAYACECGNKLERHVPLSKFSPNVDCPECGGQMGIDPVAQHRKTKGTPGAWPMESDAMGVHPAQAGEYSDYLRDKGVPTEINAEGNPILTSRLHRKRLCAVTDTYDRSAGYGDQSRVTPLPERTPRRRHGK